MKLSVVIPTRDKAERLALALASYLPQRVPGGFEIVVVADGCSDRTAEVLRAWHGRLPLRVIETPGLGQSGARNRGAEAAAGRRVGFFDDDVLLCPDYLETCCRESGERDDLVVRAPVYLLYALRVFRDPATGEPYPEYAARIRPGSAFLQAVIRPEQVVDDWDSIARQCYRLNRFERLVQTCLEEAEEGTGEPRLPWMGMSGSGVVLDRARLLAAGGYDEGFGLWWGAESLELGYRLWSAGLRFRNLPEIYSAHMDHPRETSLETYDASFERFARLHGDPAIPLIARLIRNEEDAIAALSEVAAWA